MVVKVVLFTIIEGLIIILLNKKKLQKFEIDMS